MDTYLLNKYNYIHIPQIGGNFEILFDLVVKFCLLYNKQKIVDYDINVDPILHIKGGSSIKYHFNKKKLDTINMTSDIDILIIPINHEDNNMSMRVAFISFYDALNKFIYKNIKTDKPVTVSHDNSWSKYNFSNVCSISINNNKIIDLTMYNKEQMIDVLELEDNMFHYACQKIGHNNIHGYVEKIRNKNTRIVTKNYF